MKRSTRNPVKARQEIIEKSAPVFNTHGYAGTKMQMLVDATGYQMGGIYRHFDTKMDLAKTVFEYNYRTLIWSNLQVGDSLTPKDQLYSIIANYKKMILDPAIIGGCPILNTATEVDDTDEAMNKMASQYAVEVILSIQKILERGQREGVFKSDFDSRKEANYFFATVEGAILLGKLTRRLKSIFEIFDHIELYLENRIFVR